MHNFNHLFLPKKKAFFVVVVHPHVSLSSSTEIRRVSLSRRARDERDKATSSKDRSHEGVIKLSPVVMHCSSGPCQEATYTVRPRHIVVPCKLNERVLVQQRDLDGLWCVAIR